jgi:flagellar biosynthesis chaperone FliJ
MKQLFSRLIRGIVSLAGIIVVYGVINLVFVGGQKLWHHSDHAKFDLLKAQLESEKLAISNAEARLQGFEDEMTRMEAQIESLESRIESTDRRYPSGVPSEIYASYNGSVSQYNELVDQHNSLLQNYNTLYPVYAARVDAYNEKVKKANIISKNIGGTWIIVPIPVPRGGGRLSR